MIKAEQMSLNTATVKEQCNLRQAIDLCARYGIGGIAPWRENLKECGLEEANRMIQDKWITSQWSMQGRNVHFGKPTLSEYFR